MGILASLYLQANCQVQLLIFRQAYIYRLMVKCLIFRQAQTYRLMAKYSY